MENKHGNFIISLDFELMWGVRDMVTKQMYGQHILGVHTALPKLLQYFDQFQIHATIAAVGFLFCKNKQDILKFSPQLLPEYKDKNLSPYGIYIDTVVGEEFEKDLYHYGWQLLQQIQNSPGQEIGTHTFSHYYCLEDGQNIEHFRQDLEAALSIANERGIEITSIVFPRNQSNTSYLKLCKQAGIIVYRNNENSWLYKARSSEKETNWRRALRLLDAYINISGHHDFEINHTDKSLPVNIPSSRFLRPYIKPLKWFEPLRLKRIKSSMSHAAKNNLTYHLWWHPHNFGINQDQNFLFLEKILKHFQFLKKKYNFTSYTMTELAQEILE